MTGPELIAIINELEALNNQFDAKIEAVQSAFSAAMPDDNGPPELYALWELQTGNWLLFEGMRQYVKGEHKIQKSRNHEEPS